MCPSHKALQASWVMVVAWNVVEGTALTISACCISCYIGQASRYGELCKLASTFCLCLDLMPYMLYDKRDFTAHLPTENFLMCT